jgi:Na+/proline symporter/CheY-like chemotaxis protein
MSFFSGPATIAISLAYVGLLFFIAWIGDREGYRVFVGRRRAVLYSLSLAVYCTSWTYYGSVGLASQRGLDFLPIYIGPILVFAFGRPLLQRIANLARDQNLTTVADFVSARYGKSQAVAALAALIALMASAPYIALQLKAITQTILMVIGSFENGRLTPGQPSRSFSLAVAILLAVFAMAFGTRRLNPTEHQNGLILAIATESVVKLVAFLAVGAFVVWGLFGGLSDLSALARTPRITTILSTPPDISNWLVTTALSAAAIFLLPRQYHVAIVECVTPGDLRTAGILFPLYLILINLFVLPLAIGGLLLFPNEAVNRDLTVLALPLSVGANGLALLTMIGGLSAATGMVVVESVALAITVSNDLVMPAILRRRKDVNRAAAGEIGLRVLAIRRMAIVFVLAIGYLYARFASDAALASIGLLSFAAIAQILPAFLGGLVWRRGTAGGAAAGMTIGSILWIYLLLLPSLTPSGALADVLTAGPLGVSWLRPAALVSFNAFPLVGGVVISLGANLLAFLAVSLTRRVNPLERTQGAVFVGVDAIGKPQAFRLWRASATVGDVEATVARYLGAQRARRAFEAFYQDRGRHPSASAEADALLIRHAEHLLAPAIGATTSRLVLSLLLRRRAMSSKSALKILDDASAAILSSRDQLQYALDHARQGVTVFDANLALTTWNREFVELFNLPVDLLSVGVGLDEIVRFNASRGTYGPGSSDDFIAERIASLLNDDEPIRLRIFPTQRVIEIRSARLPEGGIVTTYTDVTQTVDAEEALAAANERLERRVQERTFELEQLNTELERAKIVAEQANVSKTRFLAAAGHDILQPLNAARLYVSSLTELASSEDPEERANLTRNVDASLEAVEEILGALLDISRLDAGATKPEIGDLRVQDLFRQLDIEFGPVARSKSLTLTFVATRLTVRTDRRLMRRLLQNLVSNAIKYTLNGAVLVGCRRTPGRVRIEVWDTGLGVPEDKQGAIFDEFLRLDQGARAARGLGLGLSIVQRLGRVLGHPIGVRSTIGKGSVFSVEAPQGSFVAAKTFEPTLGPVPAQREGALAGVSILAIDNDSKVLDGMRRLLEQWGCTVISASGLSDALTSPYDAPQIILADFHLDDGDGLEAIARVRLRFQSAIPALLVTADRSAEVRGAAQSLDVEILNKPVKPAPLRALMVRHLALKTAAH